MATLAEHGDKLGLARAGLVAAPREFGALLGSPTFERHIREKTAGQSKHLRRTRF